MTRGCEVRKPVPRRGPARGGPPRLLPGRALYPTPLGPLRDVGVSLHASGGAVRVVPGNPSPSGREARPMPERSGRSLRSRLAAPRAFLGESRGSAPLINDRRPRLRFQKQERKFCANFSKILPASAVPRSAPVIPRPRRRSGFGTTVHGRGATPGSAPSRWCRRRPRSADRGSRHAAPSGSWPVEGRGRCPRISG